MRVLNKFVKVAFVQIHHVPNRLLILRARFEHLQKEVQVAAGLDVLKTELALQELRQSLRFPLVQAKFKRNVVPILEAAAKNLG